MRGADLLWLSLLPSQSLAVPPHLERDPHLNMGASISKHASCGAKTTELQAGWSHWLSCHVVRLPTFSKQSSCVSYQCKFTTPRTQGFRSMSISFIRLPFLAASYLLNSIIHFFLYGGRRKMLCWTSATAWQPQPQLTTATYLRIVNKFLSYRAWLAVLSTRILLQHPSHLEGGRRPNPCCKATVSCFRGYLRALWIGFAPRPCINVP